MTMILSIILITTFCFLAYIVNGFAKYKALLDEIEREDKDKNK